MLHIPLFITFSITLLVQPLYSMEKETVNGKKNNKILLLPKRKKSVDTATKHTASFITPRHSNDESSMSVSNTTTSESTNSSQPQSSRPKQYVRSKTVDSTPTKTKDNYSRSKTVDTALTKSSNMLKLSYADFSLTKATPRTRINILTDAVKNYDLPTIEQYFDNPEANLNQIDQYGNTALHYAVAKLTEPINNEAMLKKIITLFLQDLRTDSSITREMDKRRALDMLSGGQNPEIRTLLFAKATLDTTTNNEIGKMLLESYIYNIPLNDNLIEQTAERIKKKIETIEKEQETNNRDLPQEAKFPDYAKKENFVVKMIKYRIPTEAYDVSELQKTILKDIFVKKRDIILLNVSIDFNEESIQESIDNILNTVMTSHSYLTKFITKPCIFEMLKEDADKQKTPLNLSLTSVQKKINSVEATSTETQAGL